MSSSNEQAAIDRLVEFSTNLLTGKLTMDLTTGMKLAADYKAVGVKHTGAIQALVAQKLGWKK
jgi:hypothetical protein